MEPDTDANTVAELKERTHMLCARQAHWKFGTIHYFFRFLGGAWKEVPIDQLRISRIKWVLKFCRYFITKFNFNWIEHAYFRNWDFLHQKLAKFRSFQFSQNCSNNEFFNFRVSKLLDLIVETQITIHFIEPKNPQVQENWFSL